jgi:trehalose/maltose transport system substrate-binding protein
MAKSWIGTISPKGVTSMDGEGARNIFQGGNAAFMRNWQYAYVLCQGDDSPVKGKIGITLMPKGTAGISANTSGTEYLGVSKYSKNPEIAADFVFYMNSPESQKLKTLTSGHCPTIVSLYSDKELLKKNDAFSVFKEILQHTVNRPAIQTAPHYNKVSKIFFQAVYSALSGQNSVQSALSSAAKSIAAVTKYPIVNE